MIIVIRDKRYELKVKQADDFYTDYELIKLLDGILKTHVEITKISMFENGYSMTREDIIGFIKSRLLSESISVEIYDPIEYEYYLPDDFCEVDK